MLVHKYLSIYHLSMYDDGYMGLCLEELYSEYLCLLQNAP